jgi:hypothetical protein
MLNERQAKTNPGMPFPVVVADKPGSAQNGAATGGFAFNLFEGKRRREALASIPANFCSVLTCSAWRQNPALDTMGHRQI